MQVTRVSFMNFNGGKKIASKDLKKAENLIKEETKPAFFTDTSLVGKLSDNTTDDKYVKEYANNREVMRNLIREEYDNTKVYFAPFKPTNINK